jgi:hypothetical protein
MARQTLGDDTICTPEKFPNATISLVARWRVPVPHTIVYLPAEECTEIRIGFIERYKKCSTVSLFQICSRTFPGCSPHKTRVSSSW